MKKLWLLTLFLIIFGLAAAQQQQQAQDPAAQDPAVVEEGNYALVRVAHLSPNAPAVNIVLVPEAGTTADPQATTPGAAQVDEFEGLEYEQVSNYVALRAGDYRVQIVTADEEALAYETTINFGANDYYTVAALGFVLEGQDGEVQPVVEEQQEGNGFFDWLGGLFGGDEEAQEELTIRLQVFNDEPGTFPAAGYAHIRVIHASAGSPNVDVVWNRGGMQQQQTTAQQQPATTQQQTQQQAAATQQQEGMGALQVTVEPADAIVSVVGPDGYEDMFQGSQTLSNLPSGTYIVSATREGYEAASEEVEVDEDDTATVELTLEETEGEEAAQLREEEQPLTAEQQQRFAEREQPAVAEPGAPAAPAVTEPTVDEQIIASGLSYGNASGYEQVWAMTQPFLQIRSADAEAQAILLDLDDAEIHPGRVYTIFVTGTTFEDYAIGHVQVIDSMLGGGTEMMEDEDRVEEEEPEEEDEETETEEEEETEEENGN